MIQWVVPFLLLLQAPSLLEQADEAFRQGDLDRAVTLARQVVVREPTAVHAHMILGVAAAQRSQWEATNRHFLTVVRLDPTNPFGYFYLGQAKLYQKQWQAAITHFNKALELHYPDPPRLMVELAMAQNEGGQPQLALATLEKSSPPQDARQAAQFHAVTAFAQAKLNRWTEAIDSIRRARTQDESNVHYWDFLITALINTDQAASALGEAITAQRLFPDHADTQFLFALANHHVVESPLSKVALRNLREAEPASPRVQLAEGLHYRRLGQSDLALAAFRRAAKAGLPDAHLLLGIVYKENGDYAAAESELREAERINPSSGQLMLELGKLAFAKGDLEQARQRLEKAVQFMPDAPTAHYQLGLVYQRLGQPEKAKPHLDKVR